MILVSKFLQAIMIGVEMLSLPVIEISLRMEGGSCKMYLGHTWDIIGNRIFL